MAKLKVFLDGQLVSEYVLPKDHEFIAGRGESCDCVLRPERGISRQHFKISMRPAGWEIESLSRYGELYFGGSRAEKAILQHGQMFGVPPYEFVFEENNDRIQSEIPLPSRTGSGVLGASDRTQMGGGTFGVALLRLIDYSGQTRQTFSLQGLSWIGGRDIGCQIFIDNPKISRRQFEIQKVEEAHYIRDLASVNGTIVNSQPIPSEQWTQLKSSDVISIADWSLIFEILDPNFEARMKEVDPAFVAPVAFIDTSSNPASMEQTPPGTIGESGAMPALYLPPRPYASSSKKLAPKGMFGIRGLNPIRLAILIVAIAGGAYYFVEESGDGLTTKGIRPQSPFEKLSPDKQALVRQAYQLARDLFTTGKYELARQKIDEIHGILPYYEDSKEMVKQIDIAIQVQRDREKLIVQQEDEQRRREQVEKVLVGCRDMLVKKQASVTVADLELCLQPAIEIDPNNFEINNLKAQLEQILTTRKLQEAQGAEYKKLVARRKRMYDRARNHEVKGRLLSAIGAYNLVVMSVLPDPNGLAEKSRKKIGYLMRTIGKRQAELVAMANEEYKAGNRRQAVVLLRKALRVNPNNGEVEDLANKMIAELRKDMQGKYQESILEESVGQVEPARKKWQEIVKGSVPGEEYYEKAKAKLKKYGEVVQ